MTCFAAVDLGGQSGRVVLGRVYRRQLRYREVHRFANVPRAVTADDGTRWYWDTDALWRDSPVLAGPAEATSIGNLMVQAVAAGAFDSLDSARAAVHHGRHGPVLLEPA